MHPNDNIEIGRMAAPVEPAAVSARDQALSVHFFDSSCCRVAPARKGPLPPMSCLKAATMFQTLVGGDPKSAVMQDMGLRRLVEAENQGGDQSG